jgi:hypothetical protein
MELILVVLVLSIVAMAATPLIGRALRDSRLSQATAEVVAAMEYARSRAVASGMDVRVRFPTGGTNVVVERYAPATNLLTTSDGELIAASLVEAGGFDPLPHPLDKRSTAFVTIARERGDPTIIYVDFEGTNAVVFGACGAASATGRVEVACDADRRTITVAAGTGRIDVEN